MTIADTLLLSAAALIWAAALAIDYLLPHTEEEKEIIKQIRRERMRRILHQPKKRL